MLKNIEIENFGSYQNFNGLAENNYFKKMNIIYGANYSGKTTLSRIFALLKNKNDPENYLNPIFRIVFENEIIDSSNYKENSKDLLVGEFKHEVRQFQKPYDNQQAEQTSLMV